MFSMKRALALAALPTAVTAIAFLFAFPAQAAPILFDFEDQPIGAATPQSITESGLTANFAGPDGVDPGAFQISYNSSSGPFGAPYRLLDGAYLTVGPAFGAAGAALTITFSQALDALSLVFALDDPSNATTLDLTTDGGGALSVGGTLADGFRYPEGVLTFAGDPFTSVTISSSALDFQIDDLAATAVPEPPQAMLLVGGLAMLALARRAARR